MRKGETKSHRWTLTHGVSTIRQATSFGFLKIRKGRRKFMP